MVTTINDDMFSADVIQDPYWYYGQLRDEDPVHWNELYELWVITRHDDLVWLTRNHEQFSNQVMANDPRPAYPAILESDNEIYDYTRRYQSKMFIQYDRPEHLEMRKVVHAYFTPKSMEEWRPLVRNATNELLDAAEARGDGVDLMRDLAVPLPVLVIAEMMGVPEEERHHIRMLAEKLLSIGRGEPDRLRQLSDGMRGMDEYVAPMIEERMVNPKDDFISVLASGEKAGIFDREQVLVNTALLLLAGHETTINLICNGTMALLNNRDQWDMLKADPQGVMVRATEEAPVTMRRSSPSHESPRKTWRCAGNLSRKTTASGGSSHLPTATLKNLRTRTRWTSHVGPIPMWPSVPVYITVWELPSPE